jgi:hypothetical protein
MDDNDDDGDLFRSETGNLPVWNIKGTLKYDVI